MASNSLDRSSDFDSCSNFSLDLHATESSYSSLQALDDTLRCRICFDYFKNCMVTKCSHNYCSVCIRRYMSLKAQCPLCFEEAFESELRNNRIMDEVLRIYLRIKDNLPISAPGADPHSKDDHTQPPLVHIKSELLDHTLRDEVVKKRDGIGEIRMKMAKGKEETAKEKEWDDVSCPVCYKVVNAQHINIHLDGCLKSKNEDPEASRKKTLPKLVYHLLSDKDIRKKLREHGLSATGDKTTLIRRHKSFVILYNSNCDALYPKPVSELVKELEHQELEEKMCAVPKKSQVNKKSDIAIIEKEHASYVKQHQSQFNSLIQNVQDRHLGRIRKNEQAETSVKKEESDSDKICDTQYSSKSDDSTFIFNESIVKIEEESDDGLLRVHDPVMSSCCEDSEIALDKSQKFIFRKRKKERMNDGKPCSPKKM